MSRDAVPMAWPYLTTASPARIARRASLWPRGIASATVTVSDPAAIAAPAASGSSAVATLSRALTTSAGFTTPSFAGGRARRRARCRVPAPGSGSLRRGDRASRGGRARRAAPAVALAAAFLRLEAARFDEVIVHRAAGGLGVARANGLVDAPMRFGRRPQIPVGGAHRRLAALLVIQRRDHLDQRRHDRIRGAGRDGAMEVEVVDEKPLRIVHHREQARDFVPH